MSPMSRGIIVGTLIANGIWVALQLPDLGIPMFVLGFALLGHWHRDLASKPAN